MISNYQKDTVKIKEQMSDNKNSIEIVIEISEGIRDQLSSFLKETEDTRLDLSEVREEIVFALEEVNSLVSKYNDLASDYNQKFECHAEEMDEYFRAKKRYLDDLKHEHQSEGELPEGFEELEDWLDEWEDFSQTTLGFSTITELDEIDEPYYLNDDDEINEIERHYYGNQPKYSVKSLIKEDS